MQCCLLNEPKVRGYRKVIENSWLKKGMFQASEQRLVDQANRLGVKIDKAVERKEPMWRKRLQKNIKELRKDLS